MNERNEGKNGARCYSIHARARARQKLPFISEFKRIKDIKMFIHVNFRRSGNPGKTGVYLRAHSSALADGMTQSSELFETLLPFRFGVVPFCARALTIN